MQSSRIGRIAKWWLYIGHRWIGIATSLLFAIWFISGLVMIYVPFPGLSQQERLAGLDPVQWQEVKITPEAVLKIAGERSHPEALDLEMVKGEPAWRIQSATGKRGSWSARDGRQLDGVGPQEAKAIAARFARLPVEPALVETVYQDQWTVAERYDRDRPLHRVAFGDVAGTTLYVSSISGAVVLDTNRTERFWNWLGSIPHWIYFTPVRAEQPLWRQVVMWVSGVGIVAAITGMWIGILRIRLRRRYSGDRMSPYRGWHKWHHVSGLIGGALLTTWIISGWFSVDPFRLFATPGLSQEARAAYAQSGTWPTVNWAALPANATHDARRVRLRWVAGVPLLIMERAKGDPTIIDARSGQRAHLSNVTLSQAAQRLFPDSDMATSIIGEETAHYYAAKEPAELPVLRFAFNDPLETHVYISPKTGAIVQSDDSTRRAYRWVFNGLHSWDLEMLTANRPVWDLALWIGSILGLILSVSSIVIGWRRLRVR